MTKPPPLNIKEDRTPEQLARHGDDPNDIVKRLRETATQWGILRINNPAMLEKAADEIERLRAKNRELREAITHCIHDRRDWMETALRALEGK